MDMDIHFSDEEDYNSDSESVWDEEEIKTGGKVVKKSNQEDDKEKEDDDNSNADIEEKEDNTNAEESDAEEDDYKEDDSDIEEENEDDGGDEDEYYPEEDAGDKEEIIVKEEDRITSDVLSKYEIVELISIRSTQISKGDMPFTSVTGLRDPISMAKKEIYDNRCPLLVKRHIGNNMYEYWNPNNMSKPKI